MTLEKLIKHSVYVGLNALSMGILLVPILWFSGGLYPRDNPPVQPMIKSSLPFMLAPTN